MAASGMGANTAEIQCCLTTCCNGPITPHTGRIEIRSALPSSGLKSVKSKLKVKWTNSGDATFHFTCWELVLKAALARSTKNAPFFLIAIEKAMIKDAKKTAERHDSIDRIKSEAARIASMIKNSKYCVAFTGAGISTSAGIGDYRGKSGKWTEEAREGVNLDHLTGEGQEEEGPPPSKKRKEDHNKEDKEQEEEEGDGVPYEDLRPTYCHEALSKLLDLGYIKYVISQNCDGLHGLSGIPSDKLAELHGNVFVEKCEKCGNRYERDQYVMDDQASWYYEELEDLGETDLLKPPHAKQCDKCKLSHRTGRKCSEKKCNGYLIDTIINFRDHLEDAILERASKEAGQNDLMLCLGSTVTVTPASELVEMGEEPLRIVICNRQKTGLDFLCKAKDGEKENSLGSKVFGDCDQLMREVMKNILSEEDLQKWESGREERMKLYDSQRPTSNKV